MQFLDKVRIVIKAGSGGDGCSAFHREKFVMKGGPSGGDGGNGGNLVFRADPGKNTLLEFRYQRFYRAENGEKGKAKMQRGKDGEALVISVPVGTVVRDVQTGTILADMSEAYKERTVLKGGRGGKGNARYATPTHQAPTFAQNGVKTEEREVELELKTIADAGLIGLPSVGKSSILSVLTAAKPKIAAYHFTTLTPNLGVAEHKGRSFVLADIPGLIEGAAEGAGLGHDFLRHIERTRVLIHVLDAAGSEGRDPLEDFEKINGELAKFSEALGQLPQVVAANKMDLPEAQEHLARIQPLLEQRGYRVYPCLLPRERVLTLCWMGSSNCSASCRRYWCTKRRNWNSARLMRLALPFAGMTTEPMYWRAGRCRSFWIPPIQTARKACGASSRYSSNPA